MIEMAYKDLFKYDIEIPMDKIYDLSIVEVFSLLFLLIHRRDVVRYSLFIEVQNFLNIKLSTSSFYNSLYNLEKKGLLSFEKTSKGKIKSMSPTERTYPAIIKILKNIFYLRMTDYPPTYFEMFNFILTKLKKAQFKTTLTIWFNDFIDLDLIPEIANINDEIFILCKENHFDGINKLEIDNIRQTTIFNGKIREANEFFEVAVIPYFKKHLANFEQYKILEVGCAEAGFLDALCDLNIEAMGLELSPVRVKRALNINPQLKIITGDITDPIISEKITDRFNLIVLRDVLEHIPNRPATFANLNKLLHPDGYIYISFPPKFSGFAGHQQNGRSILRYIPYLQLAPNWKIRWLGRLFNERPELIENVILNYANGLTIRAFKKYYMEFHFVPVVKEVHLIRPIYKIRFHLNPIKIPNIPLIREFMAFGCEYLLQKKIP